MTGYCCHFSREISYMCTVWLGMIIRGVSRVEFEATRDAAASFPTEYGPQVPDRKKKYFQSSFVPASIEVVRTVWQLRSDDCWKMKRRYLGYAMYTQPQEGASRRGNIKPERKRKEKKNKKKQKKTTKIWKHLESTGKSLSCYLLQHAIRVPWNGFYVILWAGAPETAGVGHGDSPTALLSGWYNHSKKAPTHSQHPIFPSPLPSVILLLFS